MLTMAPIAQPYSQDACGIGYGAFSALGWAESRFGIDFLVVFFSIVIVSVIIVSLDAPPPLLSPATPKRAILLSRPYSFMKKGTLDDVPRRASRVAHRSLCVGLA